MPTRAAYLQKWKQDNPEKVRGYHRAYRRNHPEQDLNYRRLKKYGITPAEFKRMFLEQGRRCAMVDCRAETPGGRGDWHLDHDAKTGKVRGILCTRCNLALGIHERRRETFEQYLGGK